jgi:hypothetical protein
MIRFNTNNQPNFKKSIIFVSKLIRRIFKGDRLKRISNTLLKISKEISLKERKKIIILDFGCGSMEISKKLQTKSHVLKIIGTDIFEANYKINKIEYLSLKEFKKYHKKFDLVIVVDVLHHIGVDKAHKILKNLSKMSKYILVKDHFEYGFISRNFLRFVDFYANYGYGVNIPRVYFNNKSWHRTITRTNLKQIKLLKNFQQHDGFFNFLLNKKHHFISLLLNEKF